MSFVATQSAVLETKLVRVEESNPSIPLYTTEKIVYGEHCACERAGLAQKLLFTRGGENPREQHLRERKAPGREDGE